MTIEEKRKLVAEAGFEVMPAPYPDDAYFIFSARWWVEDSALCDTEEDALDACIAFNNLGD